MRKKSNLEHLSATHVFFSQSFLLVTGESYSEVSSTLAKGFEPTVHQCSGHMVASDLYFRPTQLRDVTHCKLLHWLTHATMTLQRVSPKDSHHLIYKLCGVFSITGSGLGCVTDNYGKSNGISKVRSTKGLITLGEASCQVMRLSSHATERSSS